MGASAGAWVNVVQSRSLPLRDFHAAYLIYALCGLIAFSAGSAGAGNGIARDAGALLRNRFPVVTRNDLAGIAGIIALGGSHARIEEAIRLARRFPGAKLVLTGVGAADEAYARRQELPSGQLLIEPNATTTFENAVFSKLLLAPNKDDKWVIVTSAIHMPRAVGVFRHEGFSVEAWPVFDDDAADDRDAVLHEVVGLTGYWLLGRMGTLFPGPTS